jgi:hypothetical protein
VLGALNVAGHIMGSRRLTLGTHSKHQWAGSDIAVATACGCGARNPAQALQASAITAPSTCCLLQYTN